MWFSSTAFGLLMVFGLSYLPALDTEVTFSASLYCSSDCLNTRQWASYVNYDGFTTIPCDVLWGNWSLAFFFSPILDPQLCWQKGLKINRERVLVQTSIHILAPACSLSKPTVCDPLMIQVYPTKNKGFFFTHNHLPHVSLLGGNLQYEMQGCLQRKVNNLPRMVPCSPLIKGNVS